MVKQLRVLAGPDKGRFFLLPEQGSCTVGTSHLRSEIRINDPSAARAHCEVLIDGDRLTVTDLGSPGGTWVNGQRITRRPLNLGDVLRLGTTDLRFEEMGAEGEAESVTV